MAREGKRNEVYLDTVGVPTVGFGHTGPEVVLGDVWTDEQVRDAFARDIQRFEDAINEAVTVELEQNQFDALVSWLYNVGTGWARRAILIRKLNAGDVEGAAVQFDQWHIPPEITSRRNAEREQFRGSRFEARIGQS